jgi:electron transport complex protein RnfG
MNNPNQALTQPPNLFEMVKMVFGLTVVCVAAAAILGGIYYWTEPIKERNQGLREQQMLRSLLELPATARVAEVRRYITKELQTVYLTGKNLVITNEQGQVVNKIGLPAEWQGEASAEAVKSEDKDKWVEAQVAGATPASRFFLVYAPGGEIGGYIIEAVTNGYKAKIRFFVALGSDLKIHALEILEQEEDPGLGGEIAQNYFKNQFAGRTAEELLNLEVKKEPLPLDWKKSLETLGAIPFSQWEKDNAQNLQANNRIYAITGATISSDAINLATKKAVGAFKKRLALLAGDL